MLGVSYDGWTTIMGAIEPHPALKAISPQASPADMWLGDDFHHNGAFRLSYGFEYAAMMESGKDVQQFSFDRYDTFDWYLSLGPLANVNAKYLHGKIPTWNDYVAHPDYDEFWKRQTMVPHLTSVKVPTLNVAGWWDQEDFYGPVAHLRRAREARHAGHQLPRRRAVASRRMGGRHRRSARRDSIRQRHGGVLPREDPGAVLRVLPEGQGHARLPAGDHVRGRRERVAAMGPVAADEADRDARACTSAPNETLAIGDRCPSDAEAAGFDEYVSDPAHPVPYRHRPIQPTYFPGGSKWSTWLVEDQRFVDDRADVLSWETAPLNADVTIAGEVVAQLFASTTGSDADWIVKLIDVYPEDNPVELGRSPAIS